MSSPLRYVSRQALLLVVIATFISVTASRVTAQNQSIEDLLPAILMIMGGPIDSDGDGVPDDEDALPLNPLESRDNDGDGLGDNEDPDDDNDGVLDFEDAFAFDPNESVDTDGDGVGNNEDTDDDNDGALDDEDAFPLNDEESLDTDNDGLGNNADDDDDGDGYADNNDLFVLDPTEWADNDLDGIGDNADRDDDNDFIPDGADDYPFDSELSNDDGLRNLAAESDAAPPQSTITGVAVDGYINGATAFLDIDFDGELDPNEPSGITDALGEFELTLSGAALQCESLAPVVVNVPVGAVDSEQGIVTDAYQMVSPPSFASSFISSEAVTLSPLTSALWTEIKAILGLDSGSAISCADLAREVSRQEAVSEALTTAIRSVVRRYNITEAQIYADFLAGNDDGAKQQALDIVRGLKRSFSETAALRAQYPAADWAEVAYFKFSSLDNDDAYPEAWYKEINYKDGQLAIQEVSKLTDDLADVQRLILRGEREFSSVPGIGFQREREYESRGGDESAYSCNDKETATVRDFSGEYELVNLTSQGGVASSDDCAFTSFAESIQTRYLFTRQFHSDGSETGAQFIFDIANNGYTGLESWVDFIDRGDELNALQLKAFVSNLPYEFCSDDDAGAISVTRARTIPGEDFNTVIDRNSNGTYTIRKDYPDGRSESETVPQSSFSCQIYAEDIDEDGLVNSEDPDMDGDGVDNESDMFPRDPAESSDSDGDGIGDNADLFDDDPTEWFDSDGDGIGDNLDEDADNDGVTDELDAFPTDDRYATDTDGDGVPDEVDDDADNDGVDDRDDAFPLDARVSRDSDGDGVGDALDEDDDNDGVADSVDAFPLDPLESLDSDNDGIGDNADAFPQNADESRDSDGDGVGDREDAYPFNPDEYLAWGERNHLEPVITRAQAATIRITSSTGVIIAPRYAITAAHSPLDGNNEITPNLIAENAWGEQRRIVDVLYDVQRDFAIVEFEEPFEKFGTVPLATEAPPTGSEAFVVGNPGYSVASQLTRSVSFGTVTNYLEPDGFERFSDFHIYGGYSGSGVYNQQGELLGIVSMAGSPDYSPFYDPDLPLYNTTFDMYLLENVYTVPLSFINQFMDEKGVSAELIEAPELPEKIIDRPKLPLLTEEEIATLDPIREKVRQASVMLHVGRKDNFGNYSRRPLCTGSLISRTLVITASHCMEEYPVFSVVFTGREVRHARAIDMSTKGDVAILELESPAPDHYPHLGISIESMAFGDYGLMVGHPKEQYNEFGGWILSTIKANIAEKGWASYWGHSGGGSSGGPLVNRQGDIVGVINGGSNGLVPVGKYDDGLFYDIQDPHLQDTSPWPAPYTVSYKTYASTTDVMSALALDYVNRDGLSRILAAKYEEGFIYDLKELHGEVNRVGTLERKIADTGELDTTFGDGGVVNLGSADGVGLVPRAMHVASNGEVFVLADTAYTKSSTLMIIRLAPNGEELDRRGWSADYLKGVDLIEDNAKFYVAADFITGDQRDVAVAACSSSELSQTCGSLNTFDLGGHDYAAGLATNSEYLVLGGDVDPLSRKRTVDMAAFFLDKETVQPIQTIGDGGLVLWRRSENDDSERVFGIEETSDGGFMLLGNEWSWDVSVPAAVKVTAQGVIDQTFGANGAFRPLATPRHYKGNGQFERLIETSDYYVFVGSQNFSGYGGSGIYAPDIVDIFKSPLVRDEDLVVMITDKEGSFAPIEQPLMYFDGKENEVLLDADLSNDRIAFTYATVERAFSRLSEGALLSDRELNYLQVEDPNSPTKFHNESTRYHDVDAVLMCYVRPQTKELILSFDYSTFSDKDGVARVTESYWTYNESRFAARESLTDASLRLPDGQYQYFMSYEDGRGKIETIETQPFDLVAKDCPFRD